ncbi:hypothetical protein PVAP13_1NG198638 [Panicum virgatum]|uniref:Uncharacterized protein n=1 Tax=Panicum virgatum TaxID=38727 RepID=A0A8T0X403_PANVG|nr:hypothetical protein PVAP13_1NG198638 [Panicum virgatum]
MVCVGKLMTSRWRSNICVSNAHCKEVICHTSSCEAPAGCAATEAQRPWALMIT